MLAPDIEIVTCELVRHSAREPELLRIGVMVQQGKRTVEKVVEHTYVICGPQVVELTTSAGEIYRVGPRSCTCRDFQFRRRPSFCKHVRSLASLGFFETQTPKEEPTNEYANADAAF